MEFLTREPLVSVVMPVYNGVRFLTAAIESILNQTLTDFEFIIVNDGSNDNSQESIADFAGKDKRIIVISRENRGLVASLNEGIAEAKGKYIARMDADDVAMPERLYEQVKLLENSNCGLCGSWCLKIDEQDRENGKSIVPVESENILLSMTWRNPIVHPSVMFRRKLFEKYSYGGRFDSVEDFELWLKILPETSFYNIPQFLLKYRVHQASFSSSKYARMQKDKLILHREFVEANRDRLLSIIGRQLKANEFKSELELFNVLVAAWKCGLYAQSCWYYLKNLRRLFPKLICKYWVINLNLDTNSLFCALEQKLFQ
jgi:glycosyltransferase involved in cell wall biosynthesis